MIEYLFGALALGIAYAYVMPLIAGLVKGFIPASMAGDFTVPTTFPATLTAGMWSVVFSGALLALSVWLVAKVGPLGRGIRELE